jgi:hypothetical protein
MRFLHWLDALMSGNLYHHGCYLTGHDDEPSRKR